MAEQPIIRYCHWYSMVSNIYYRCSCGSNIRLVVYRSGQTYMRVEPSLEYPVVEVVWDDNMTHIRSTHCNVSTDFYFSGDIGHVEILL